MTYTELQNQVRILLDETSTNYITDAEVQSSINRCLPQMALDIDDMLTFCDYTTVAGTYRYQLPADYMSVKRVELIISATLTETLDILDLNDYAEVSRGATTSQAIPRWFKVELGATEIDNDPQRPGDIWLYPVPDDNGGAEYTVRMYYFQQPTALTTGTEIPEFPQMFHMAIAYKAAAELAIKGKNFQLTNFLEQKFEKDMAKGRAYYNKGQRVRPHFTKDVMGYGDTGE